MKQVTLNIKEGKFRFFMELIKNFDFVHVEKDEGDPKEEILTNIKQGLEEVKLIEQGKIKSRPAKALLDEL